MDAQQERLLELQTRIRLALDLTRVVTSLRTDSGWCSDELVDESLERLKRQLELLDCAVAHLQTSASG